MADETGTPGAEAASESAPSAPAAAETGSTASAFGGNAPAEGGDVGAGGETQGNAPSVSPAARFSFLNRNFNDLKHAEQVFGSEIGRTRTLQTENNTLKSENVKIKAEIDALRGLVAERQPQGRGQGVRGGPQPPSESKTFARELAENGELNLIAKMFADPEMGPAHAMYRMAELLEQRQEKRLGELEGKVTGTISEREARQQHEATVARALTAAQSLFSEYPELEQETDEARQAQEVIMGMITNSPPIELANGNVVPRNVLWLAQDPSECIRHTVEKYRRTYGTPIFAQQPGTSGSLSGRAAAAAEAGNAATALDGSGVPRQRTNGQPETAADRIRRENREMNARVVKTPSGRPLWAE